MSSTVADFRGLTLQDALDLAIQIEDAARARYEELADQLEQHSTPEAAEFFRSMATNETNHRIALEQCRKTLFGEKPARAMSNPLDEIEAPAYDSVRAFMTRRQALDVALQSEEKAHAFFCEALEHVEDRDVRALLSELRDEEVHHQRLVQEQMAELAVEPPGSAEDYADEPVPG